MSGSALENVVPLTAPVVARQTATPARGQSGVARSGEAVAPTRKAPSALFDKIGAVLGFACAIHCILVPLALGVLPALGLGFLADEGVDHTIVGVATVFAAIAAFIGWRTHHERRIVLAFAGSIGLLFLAHAAGEHSLGARMISVAGGLGLAAAHLWNTRRSRTCSLPGHTHAAH